VLSLDNAGADGRIRAVTDTNTRTRGTKMKIRVPSHIRLTVSKSAEVQSVQLATGQKAYPGQEVDWPAGAAAVVWHRKGRLNVIVGDETLNPVGLHSDGSHRSDDTVGTIDIDDLVI